MGSEKPDEANALLKQMAMQASAITKIIASWIVALVVFGVFGIWQTHWRLSEQRGELQSLQGQVKVLRRQLSFDDPAKLSSLRECSRESFTDIPAELVYWQQHRAAERRTITPDFCTLLATRPDLPKTSKTLEMVEKFRNCAQAGASADRNADAAVADLRGPRLAAHAICGEMGQKAIRLQVLEARQVKAIETYSDIALKTPLFETKLHARIAPIAELALLAAGVFYLDRKRREMAASYLRAMSLHGLEDRGKGASDQRIKDFNELVAINFGPAPLWLLPFPLVTGLDSRLFVRDTLGRNGRDAGARRTFWFCALLATMCAMYLFAAVVSLDLATFSGEAHRSSRIAVDASFFGSLALMVTIACLLYITASPWSPGSTLPVEQRRHWLMLCAVYVVATPVAIAATDKHGWLRARLPRVNWLRRLANAALPGRPRLRSRGRWVSRWHSWAAPIQATTLVYRPPSREAESGATGRLRLHFPEQFRTDGRRWFGSPWSESAKARASALEPKDWPDAIRGKQPPQARMSQSELSLTVEVVAWHFLKATSPRIDDALNMLLAGIARAESSHRHLGPGHLKALRLYDMCAAMAARYGRGKVINDLIERALANRGSEPVIDAEPLAKFVGERASLRRLRKRSANGNEELSYRQRLWNRRLAQWTDANSDWYKKWSGADPKQRKEWKLGIAVPQKHAVAGQKKRTATRPGSG